MLDLKENDEQYTPPELAKAMVSLIPPSFESRTIWNPFAVPDDTISQSLKDAGFLFLETGLQLNGQDFFQIASKFIDEHEIELVVTNIPFSKKNDIIKELNYHGIPIVTLLPSRAIGGQGLYETFKSGQSQHHFPFNIVFLPKRVPYNHRNNNLEPSFLLYQIPTLQTVDNLHLGTTQTMVVDYKITSADVRKTIWRRCASCRVKFEFCMCCKKRVHTNICPCLVHKLGEKKWCSDSKVRNNYGILCVSCDNTVLGKETL